MDANEVPDKEILNMLNRYGVPEHMHGAYIRYILHGIRPGGFLSAVLSNDLFGAIGKADRINRDALRHHAEFIYNCTPATCWGSLAKVNKWIADGGLVGVEGKANDKA